MGSERGVRWVGLDPSLTGFGWAVLEQQGRAVRPNVIAAGLWQTAPDSNAKRKTDDRGIRVGFLAQSLWDLFEAHGPFAAIGCEETIWPDQMSRGSVNALGRVRGLIDMIAVSTGFELVSFLPQALKKAISGNRSAEKKQIASLMVRAYPELRQLFPGKLDDNISDAVAVAHLVRTAPSIQMALADHAAGELLRRAQQAASTFSPKDWTPPL